MTRRALVPFAEHSPGQAELVQTAARTRCRGARSSAATSRRVPPREPPSGRGERSFRTACVSSLPQNERFDLEKIRHNHVCCRHYRRPANEPGEDGKGIHRRPGRQVRGTITDKEGRPRKLK